MTKAIVEGDAEQALAQFLLKLEKQGESDSHWTVEEYLDELRSFAGIRYFSPGDLSLENALQNPERIDGFVFARGALDELWVVHLAVFNKGSGKGTQLLESFLSKISQEGHFKTVGLEVKSSNASAVALYKKVGFVEIAQRKKYYRDGSDASIMRLLLERHQ